MEKYIETVNSLSGEMKIRDYLRRRLGLSVSLIATVKYDNVRINGIPVHMRATVKNGDVIEITLPPEDSENIEPMDVPIEIVYEDDYIIAVNKPRNMPVHPSRGNHLPTVANAVRSYLGHPFVFRAVNRLDRDTSGIVLIAKDRLSGAKLYQAMKDRKIDKTYLAVVEGIPNSHGIIDAPITREAEGEIKRVVREDGKRCVTEYELISTDEYGNSLVKVLPHTGRTHQIRVHMAHIGHPLVNDFLYGTRGEDTYFLHAASLSFPHPITNELITVSAEPPKE
ncbi:MAG: RluA family pseudouridine synthase [Clostridia bacterium]|nr:RluA family pseudouridine synthase [Clostridia bacterium]